jgi:hypothetical protein
MEFTDEKIQALKNALEEAHGREFSWQEAAKAAHDLSRLAMSSFEMASEEVRRKQKLKEMPKGFHLDKAGYTCHLCDRSASSENSWYDKYGLKCITCQNALDKRIIPGSIVKNKEAWYSKYELEMYFNLKCALLNRCIKANFLKDRKIPGKGESVHLQLFLIKDNKDILPPKTLLNSRTIKIIKDGEEYFTSEYWYEFADEKRLKQICKYRIAEVFKETFAEPIKSGRFYYKQLNPLFVSK